jgi:hypothetical protein
MVTIQHLRDRHCQDISSGKSRKYIHDRFRHPASRDTDTSMYGVWQLSIQAGSR